MREAILLAFTAGLALFVARRLHIDLGGLWVVLQAVVILKPTLKDSITMARDQAIGTTIGVCFGAAFAVIEHPTLGVSLAVLLTALVCGAIPMLRRVVNIACVGAAIVILLPGGKPSYITAWDRMFDTLLGAAIALTIVGLASLTTRRMSRS